MEEFFTIKTAPAGAPGATRDGLVTEAGLNEPTDDDRDVIFGLLLGGPAMLQSERRDEMLTLWQRRGKRAFALAADAYTYK